MEIQLEKRYYRPFTISYVKAYIVTMRPYLMFVSGITGITGMSFGQSESAAQILLIFFAAFLSYGFGQALTDCFQTDTDSISSPYRPLTQNLVSRKAFLITSITGLIFCISILYYYYQPDLLLGLIAGSGLATYTWFKRRWWGGPFYNAWIVALLFFMCFFAVGGTGITIKVVSAASVVFFGYANFVLSGYFKDIEADRATGYNTLPVIFGKKISAYTSDIFALAAVISALLIILVNKEGTFINPASIGLFSAGIITSAYAQLKLHKVQSDEEAHKAIAPVVHSYIFLLAAVILNNKPGWLIPLLIFVCGYFIVLKLRPSKAQI